MLLVAMPGAPSSFLFVLNQLQCSTVHMRSRHLTGEQKVQVTKMSGCFLPIQYGHLLMFAEI